MNLQNQFRNHLLIFIIILFTANVTFAADTMRQHQFEVDQDHYKLKLVNAPIPSLGVDQILVKVHAVSLNRRDIGIFESSVENSVFNGLIPLSDGAGEVVDVGENVTEFKRGDRVAGTFFTKWNDGKPDAASFKSARGGDVNGMLAEMVVADEESLVRIPDYLSYVEAATLPCAGLTAWNGLFKAGNLQENEYVLLEGTGGVSTFGLMFASAAGAKPIITSSSDAKLERAKSLGAVGTVNYKNEPEWQDRVRDLTGGVGVDHVLEVGGARTLPKAIETLAYGGHLANIGGLSGFDTQINVRDLIFRSASATGIYVGSKADFEDMLSFLEQHKIRPLIDRIFSFEDASEAYAYMQNSSFMGKIVIRVSSDQ